MQLGDSCLNFQSNAPYFIYFFSTLLLHNRRHICYAFCSLVFLFSIALSCEERDRMNETYPKLPYIEERKTSLRKVKLSQKNLPNHAFKPATAPMHLLSFSLSTVSCVALSLSHSWYSFGVWIYISVELANYRLNALTKYYHLSWNNDQQNYFIISKCHYNVYKRS